MEIQIKTVSGEYFLCEVNEETTVLEIKQMIQEKESRFSVNEFYLSYNGKILDERKTLKDYSIVKVGSIFNLFKKDLTSEITPEVQIKDPVLKYYIYTGSEEFNPKLTDTYSLLLTGSLEEALIVCKARREKDNNKKKTAIVAIEISKATLTQIENQRDTRPDHKLNTVSHLVKSYISIDGEPFQFNVLGYCESGENIEFTQRSTVVCNQENLKKFHNEWTVIEKSIARGNVEAPKNEKNQWILLNPLIKGEDPLDFFMNESERLQRFDRRLNSYGVFGHISLVIGENILDLSDSIGNEDFQKILTEVLNLAPLTKENINKLCEQYNKEAYIVKKIIEYYYLQTDEIKGNLAQLCPEYAQDIEKWQRIFRAFLQITFPDLSLGELSVMEFVSELPKNNNNGSQMKSQFFNPNDNVQANNNENKKIKWEDTNREIKTSFFNGLELNKKHDASGEWDKLSPQEQHNFLSSFRNEEPKKNNNGSQIKSQFFNPNHNVQANNNENKKIKWEDINREIKTSFFNGLELNKKHDASGEWDKLSPQEQNNFLSSFRNKESKNNNNSSQFGMVQIQ